MHLDFNLGVVVLAAICAGAGAAMPYVLPPLFKKTPTNVLEDIDEAGKLADNELKSRGKK